MIVAMACSALLAAAAPPTSLPTSQAADKYDAQADPVQQLAQATALARTQHKRVLMIVGRDSCRWTRALDALLGSDRAIAGALDKNFVLLRVHRSKDHDNSKFLARFPKIDGVPHLLVLDAAGKLLASQETGSLEQGDGHDPAKVLAFLDKWAGAGK
jgi:thioredoxin-related protein